MSHWWPFLAGFLLSARQIITPASTLLSNVNSGIHRHRRRQSVVRAAIPFTSEGRVSDQVQPCLLERCLNNHLDTGAMAIITPSHWMQQAPTHCIQCSSKPCYLESSHVLWIIWSSAVLKFNVLIDCSWPSKSCCSLSRTSMSIVHVSR